MIHHDPEGHGAHRVADICELLLPRELKHIVEHCWQIALAHLVEGEMPELFSGGVKNCVLSAVGVPPEVSQPHGIASVSKYEAFVDGMCLNGLLWTLPSALSRAPSTQSTEEQIKPC